MQWNSKNLYYDTERVIRRIRETKRTRINKAWIALVLNCSYFSASRIFEALVDLEVIDPEGYVLENVNPPITP